MSTVTESHHSNKTLLIAFGANMGVAVAKFVAAAITGSSAMLTEGIHSVVDSLNQLLLIWGRRQARKPADKYHPFGHGREIYFWSFVVAVLVFALGAGVSIYEGVIHILDPEVPVSPIIAYVVLALAFLLEGWSTRAAFNEFKLSKGQLGWFEAIRHSKDPPTFIVLLENGAAMAGILAAAIGVLATDLSGNPFYDGVASVIIGSILAVTAVVLAVESKGLLIGESADLELVQEIRELVEAQPGVVGVGDILTIHAAPDQVTVMMSVDFLDSISAGQVERLIHEAEREASERWPIIRRFFIRPQQGASERSIIARDEPRT